MLLPSHSSFYTAGLADCMPDNCKSRYARVSLGLICVAAVASKCTVPADSSLEVCLCSYSCPGVYSGQGCGAKLKWIQFREGGGCWGCSSWPACDYKEAATERLATPRVTLEAVSKDVFKASVALTGSCALCTVALQVLTGRFCLSWCSACICRDNTSPADGLYARPDFPDGKPLQPC